MPLLTIYRYHLNLNICGMMLYIAAMVDHTINGLMNILNHLTNSDGGVIGDGVHGIRIPPPPSFNREERYDNANYHDGCIMDEIKTPSTSGMWFRSAFIYDRTLIADLYTPDEFQESSTRANDDVSANPNHGGLKPTSTQYFRFNISHAAHIYTLAISHRKDAIETAYIAWKNTGKSISCENGIAFTIATDSTKFADSDIKTDSDGVITLTVVIDKDSINCPVCYETLGNNAGGSIVTCANGHHTCEQCIIKSDNLRCPVCRDIFIFLDHKLTETFRVLTQTCKHIGCNHRYMSYDMKKHVAECEHAPVSCNWCNELVYPKTYYYHVTIDCKKIRHIKPTFPFPNMTFILMNLIQDIEELADKKSTNSQKMDATASSTTVANIQSETKESVTVACTLIDRKYVMIVSTDGTSTTFTIVDFRTNPVANNSVIFEFTTVDQTNPVLSSVKRMTVPITSMNDIDEKSAVTISNSVYNGNVVFNDQDRIFAPICSQPYWYIRDINNKWHMGKIIGVPKFDIHAPTITVSFVNIPSTVNETFVLNCNTINRFRPHFDPPLSILTQTHNHHHHNWSSELEVKSESDNDS